MCEPGAGGGAFALVLHQCLGGAAARRVVVVRRASHVVPSTSLDPSGRRNLDHERHKYCVFNENITQSLTLSSSSSSSLLMLFLGGRGESSSRLERPRMAAYPEAPDSLRRDT